MREVRDHLGVAQAALAGRMGNRQSYVARFENAHELPGSADGGAWQRWQAAVRDIAGSKPRDPKWGTVLEDLLAVARRLHAEARAQYAAERQRSILAVAGGSLERADADPGQDEEVRRADLLKLAAVSGLASGQVSSSVSRVAAEFEGHAREFADPGRQGSSAGSAADASAFREAGIGLRRMSLGDADGFEALEVGLVPTRREMLGHLRAGLMAVGLEQLPDGLPRVLDALQVTRPDAQSFTALVEHYKQTLRTVPSASLYGELLGVRAHAGTLLQDRSAVGRSRELTVATGWLSDLLALVAYDLGDHAAALVRSIDATRRGQDAGHPELAAWAQEIRTLMAYYTGQARQAVAHAQHGQTLVGVGTVGHAKLAAQEMRAWALLGDARMVASARRRAEQAIAKLPATVPTRGAFSIRLAEDPPYTATSLLLLGHFAEAEAVTRG